MLDNTHTYNSTSREQNPTTVKLFHNVIIKTSLDTFEPTLSGYGTIEKKNTTCIFQWQSYVTPLGYFVEIRGRGSFELKLQGATFNLALEITQAVRALFSGDL